MRVNLSSMALAMIEPIGGDWNPTGRKGLFSIISFLKSFLKIYTHIY
jgi:hypothetical protein